VAFKIRQNAFPAGPRLGISWGTHDAPQTLVGWEETSISIPYTLGAPRLFRLRRLDFGGAGAPKFFQTCA